MEVDYNPRLLAGRWQDLVDRLDDVFEYIAHKLEVSIAPAKKGYSPEQRRTKRTGSVLIGREMKIPREAKKQVVTRL